MRWCSLIGLAVLAFGCAGRHPVRAEAVRAAEISIKGIGVVHARQSEIFNDRARERLAACEAADLPTAAERRSCLGGFASFSTYAADAQQMAAAYDRIVVELATIRDLSRRLDAADAEAREAEEIQR